MAKRIKIPIGELGKTDKKSVNKKPVNKKSTKSDSDEWYDEKSKLHYKIIRGIATADIGRASEDCEAEKAYKKILGKDKDKSESE